MQYPGDATVPANPEPFGARGRGRFRLRLILHPDEAQSIRCGTRRDGGGVVTKGRCGIDHTSSRSTSPIVPSNIAICPLAPEAYLPSTRAQRSETDGPFVAQYGPPGHNVLRPTQGPRQPCKVPFGTDRGRPTQTRRAISRQFARSVRYSAATHQKSPYGYRGGGPRRHDRRRPTRGLARTAASFPRKRTQRPVQLAAAPVLAA